MGALNASAIMNCMLETGAAVKIKVERGSEEEERINDLITSTGGNMEKSESQTVDNSENQAEVCKAASHEKLSAKQKLKIASSSQKRKETDDSDIVIKTEEEKNKERKRIRTLTWIKCEMNCQR